MNQARIQTFGITSTENASLKPSDAKKKPPIPEKPKLERPSIKAGESFEKKAEDQKALSSSKPTRRQLNSSTNNQPQIPQRSQIRQLTTDNQPQIPQCSEMTQAQVHVSTLGSASTETVPIKQRPVPKRRTLERPRIKAEESNTKQTEEQKGGAIYISKPCSSTAINKADQQVPDGKSHIDSDQIKEEHVPSSLSDCFKQENGTLITECLTVKVTDVQRGESAKIFAAAAICDATHACKAKVYDSKHVTKMQPNAVLILGNFYVRDGEISITHRSIVYGTGIPPEIPDDIMNKASSLLSGTKHTVSILDAAISPKKTILSVKGIVYKTNDLEKNPMRSTGEKAAFKRLKIKDQTSKICVDLWHELAEEQFYTNEVVQFNNFQVSNFSRMGKSVPSLTNKLLSRSSIQHLPSESINTDITDSEDDVILSSPKGLLLGITDLQMYKCCINGRCNKKKLIENKCPTCGVSYTEDSSGSGFVAKLMVKTDSGQNFFKIFTQQVEHLSKLLDCNIKSTSLESDIAKKLPVTITFQNNGEKITKISVLTSVDVHRF